MKASQRVVLERALLSHESVREAVLVQREGVPGELELTAYVVQRVAGAMPAEPFIAQLKAHLRAQPTLSRLPQEWLVLTSLPRTASGAVDRSSLPQPSSAGLRYVAPRTALERALVEVWQEQLGIERVGVEENYFALGGDSIRSIALVAQARERGVDFSIKDLFAHPTVSALASALERGEVRGHVETEEIEPFALLTPTEREQLGERHDMENVEDAYPLSMMQQGMVLEALRHADLKVYLNFQILRIKGSLGHAAVRTSAASFDGQALGATDDSRFLPNPPSAAGAEGASAAAEGDGCQSFGPSGGA